MYIFTSAEENNAALVSGKVTRRFPLIFSGATFPIRLLLVKWRDEPWNVEFFGWPEGESQKTQHFRAKPSTEPAKVEWEMSNQKMWVGNQAELWSWPKRLYFMKKEAKLCFPSQLKLKFTVTKITFFIEKIVERQMGERSLSELSAAEQQLQQKVGSLHSDRVTKPLRIKIALLSKLWRHAWKKDIITG